MPKAKAQEPETIDLEVLPEAIVTIFDQVQTSLANHKKNCVALYKLHLRAATVRDQVKKKNGTVSTKFTGERAFVETFLDMVNRILDMKKGPPAADRIVKFVGSYVQYLNEKGESLRISGRAILCRCSATGREARRGRHGHHNFKIRRKDTGVVAPGIPSQEQECAIPMSSSRLRVDFAYWGGRVSVSARIVALVADPLQQRRHVFDAQGRADRTAQRQGDSHPGARSRRTLQVSWERGPR